MQGFNPISSSPISDLGLLEEITGYISATDNDDTALINAEALAAGYIDTTDDKDTAILVSDNIAAGYIDATDGTDTAELLGASSIAGDINATDEDDTAVVYGQVLCGFSLKFEATLMRWSGLQPLSWFLFILVIIV